MGDDTIHPDRTLPFPAAIPSLTDAIQTHLGRELRVLYGNPDAEKMPRSLTQLLNRVAQVIRAHTEPVDQAFVDELMSSLKALRAYAISHGQTPDHCPACARRLR
jgi:hypothetical protein